MEPSSTCGAALAASRSANGGPVPIGGSERMPLLSRIDLRELSQALRTAGLDAWLLYDFHGINPVARRGLGLGGLATRRLFVWLPAAGRPAAAAHPVQLQPPAGLPW